MKLAIDVEQSFWSDPFLEVVYNCGLDIVEKKDALVIVKTASEITPEELASGSKFIALEKTSGGNIAFRSLLKHPAVIRYIKSFNYTNLDLHNSPCVDGRLFTAFLPYYTELKYPESFINAQDFKKISLSWSILHYFRLRELISLDSKDFFEQDYHRPIDIFFAGSLHYDNKGGQRKSADMLSWHRNRCVEMLESVKGYETVVVKGKLLDTDTYNQLLCNSKVVVSPWGWGEPCHRDFEALLAGCVLIKPITNYVSSVCGIFEDGYCIWTKPDFSDLPDKVIQAVNDFNSSKAKRLASRENMIMAVKKLPEIIRANLTI